MLTTFRLTGPLEVIAGVLSLFDKDCGWPVLSSLGHLELIAVGCDGTEDDYEHAESATENCRDILKKHQRKGHNFEVFKATECFVRPLEFYAKIGAGVELVPCPKCMHYQNVELPPILMADYIRELREYTRDM